MEYIKKQIRRWLGVFPYVKYLETCHQDYQQISKELGHAPGHFYSTIPSWADIEDNDKKDYSSEKIADIDFNDSKQLELIFQFKELYKDFPYDFKNLNNNANLRYKPKDAYYRYSDLIFLYSMIRHYKPSRIIEVGSGHSSAAMLDFNELFFEDDINITFIEPFPGYRLNNVLNGKDKVTAIIIEDKVQAVSISVFENLQSNDILFIDSSHVAKLGSDLNHLLFNILPILKRGVLIHFHDVFYPFELPKHWIRDRKWFWNENYILRAFLMNNRQYEVLAFNSYLHIKYKDWFMENMPDCLIGAEETGSLWMRKL